MKKFLSLLLICVMVISSLSGCGKKSEPLSGKELAKLYLANERLNAELLNKEGDIFENGTRVMETLAERAVKLPTASEHRNILSFRLTQ